MGHGESAGLFLVNTLFTLYMSVVFLRIVLRWVRANFHNPISQFIWQVTNPPLNPLMRIVPRWRQLDTAALVFLILLAIAHVALVLALTPYQAGIAGILWLAILKLLTVALNTYTFTIFVHAIMSWFGPQQANPAAAVLWSGNEPVLAPARRILPPLGGFDLSPLVVILVLQALQIWIGLPNLLR